MPTVCDANVRLVVESVAGGGNTPVPERSTVCGLVEALSAKLRVALSVPTIDGVNEIVTVHAAAGATAAPLQVSELTVKSPGFAPESVAAPEPKIKSAPPLFVTVTVCAGLEVLTG